MESQSFMSENNITVDEYIGLQITGETRGLKQLKIHSIEASFAHFLLRASGT